MTDVLTIAKNYIAYLGQVGIPVSSAYLYGSYAKGQQRDASDIDICVVSPSFAGKNFFDEMVRLNQLGLKIDSRIETVPYTQEDLDDKYSSLANEIRNTGIQIGA